MGMPEMARKWTREMVLALPDDGNRYELFGGELLVTPAPAFLHQLAVVRFYDLVAPFVLTHKIGQAMLAPADLQLGGKQLSQPDLFVVPSLPAENSWSAVPNPILVVEILSPSSASFDRTIKRRRFQQAGVAEYWIVDLDARTVERWRPEDQRPEILDERLVWFPAGALEPLDIELPEVFRSIGPKR